MAGLHGCTTACSSLALKVAGRWNDWHRSQYWSVECHMTVARVRDRFFKSSWKIALELLVRVSKCKTHRARSGPGVAVLILCMKQQSRPRTGLHGLIYSLSSIILLQFTIAYSIRKPTD